jgi:hypothetical protein
MSNRSRAEAAEGELRRDIQGKEIIKILEVTHMAIFCGKCGSKVGVTGPCKTCKKATNAKSEAIELGPTVVDVSSISEYGLTQKLSNSIRCF